MPDNVRRRAVLSGGLALGALPVVQALGTSSASADTAASTNPLIGPATGDRLHVMSFNVRLPVDKPPHSWPERRLLIRSLLERERPTILGTQEGFFFQLQEILEDLGPAYDWIHLFRQGGSKDEATAFLYDKRRLKPVAYDHLWLSDTPLLIGSKTWGNNITRMLTWVHFLDKRTNREFVVLNTHFDHQSENARQKSGEMILGIVKTFDVPTIITGDFNTPARTSVAYKTLVTDGGLIDVWTGGAQVLTPEYKTFQGWNPVPVLGDRIDWILNSQGVSGLKVGINTWVKDGNTPSDHWAVQALLRLT